MARTSRRPTRQSVSSVLLPALAGYLLIRSLVLLAVLRLRPADAAVAQGILDPLLTPDGSVVGRVAANGYGSIVRPVDGAAYADTAVLPLQPAVSRLAALATGTDLSPGSAAEMALVVSFLASLVAAAAVCLLTSHVYGPRAAVATTWLWAALPTGASLWTPAPYALLAACSVGALLAWASARPLPAALLAGAAALADPAGLGAVAAVVVGTVAALRHGRLHRATAAWTVALAAAPPAAYAVWLADRRGSPDAVLTVLQSRAETEGGLRRIVEQVRSLVDSPAVVLVAVVVAALAVGLVLAVADRQPDEIVVHAAVTVLATGLLAPSLDAAGALSLAAIGVWMPLGDALAARSRLQQALVLGVMLLSSLAWAASGLAGSPWA